MSGLIRPIPSGERNSWEVTVNGQVLYGVNEVRISHPKFGTLAFGQRPERTQGWIWQEVGGGGMGIVPYLVQEGGLFIGMIQQERHCQGGLIWNIPRGFLEPSLTHFESAEGEGAEELGIDVGERLQSLFGSPGNPNSTFFDTTAEGSGFHYYSFQVLPEEVEGEPPVFREGLFKPKSTMAERIVDCRFFPWTMAATVSEQFSNVGVARLIAHHQIKGTPLPLG